MRDTYALADAKAKLSALLDDVERGATITITRHGQPVAQLVPAPKRQVVFGLGHDLIESLPDFHAPMSEDELRDWGLK